MGYPETEGFAYSFQRGELTLGRRKYIAIKRVSIDQPTEEGVVMGTRSHPLMRTVGSMGLGEGAVEFSDEGERQRFLDDLGDNWREKTFTAKWILSAPGKPNIRKVAYGCRVLSEPDEDEEGTDALGGEVLFSFMYSSRNGKVAHSGLPAPTR